jgi:hypothetical protein
MHKTINVDYLDNENIDYPTPARKAITNGINYDGVEQILDSRLESGLQVNGCDGQEKGLGVVKQADGLEHFSYPKPMTIGKGDTDVYVSHVEDIV